MPKLFSFEPDHMLTDLHSRNQPYVYPAQTSRTVELETAPHYSDSRFDKEQTVFGKAVPGLIYEYSDRLWQWDYDKSKEAFAEADKSGKTKNSANYYDVYLSHYFGKKIRVEHIMAGVNVSNGYPYAVFGYREVSK